MEKMTINEAAEHFKNVFGCSCENEKSLQLLIDTYHFMYDRGDNITTIPFENFLELHKQASVYDKSLEEARKRYEAMSWQDRLLIDSGIQDMESGGVWINDFSESAQYEILVQKWNLELEDFRTMMVWWINKYIPAAPKETIDNFISQFWGDQMNFDILEYGVGIFADGERLLRTAIILFNRMNSGIMVERD